VFSVRFDLKTEKYTMQTNPTTHFDLDDAIFLAKISELVYQDESLIREVMTGKFPNFAFIDIHKSSGYDTEAIVAGNAEMIVVAFRGTEADSLEDWVSNLDKRPMPCFIGNVHQGFWESLEQIWQSVSSTIAQFQDKNQVIYLTGHSQGGALATLAARRLVEQGVDVQGVYTFGQPKVGDMLFTTNYEVMLPQKTFRIYNEGDTVIDCPPRLFHVGMGVKLFTEGGFEIENDFNTLETGGGSFASLLDSLFDYASDGLQVHKIEEYVRRLEGCK
jgi:triacylglycerol lipase